MKNDHFPMDDAFTGGGHFMRFDLHEVAAFSTTEGPSQRSSPHSKMASVFPFSTSNLFFSLAGVTQKYCCIFFIQKKTTKSIKDKEKIEKKIGLQSQCVNLLFCFVIFFIFTWLHWRHYFDTAVQYLRPNFSSFMTFFLTCADYQ